LEVSAVFETLLRNKLLTMALSTMTRIYDLHKGGALDTLSARKESSISYTIPYQLNTTHTCSTSGMKIQEYNHIYMYFITGLLYNWIRIQIIRAGANPSFAHEFSLPYTCRSSMAERRIDNLYSFIPCL